MLEDSIRKLVREEARAASTDALADIRKDISAAIRGGLEATVRSAWATMDHHRREQDLIARNSGPVSARIADVPTSQPAQLIETRTRTIELARQIAGNALDDEDRVLEIAAKLARFILDGEVAA